MNLWLRNFAGKVKTWTSSYRCVKMPCLWCDCLQTLLNWNAESLEQRDGSITRDTLAEGLWGKGMPCRRVACDALSSCQVPVGLVGKFPRFCTRPPVSQRYGCWTQFWFLWIFECLFYLFIYLFFFTLLVYKFYCWYFRNVSDSCVIWGYSLCGRYCLTLEEG
jgi:hypothetical protein